MAPRRQILGKRRAKGGIGRRAQETMAKEEHHGTHNFEREGVHQTIVAFIKLNTLIPFILINILSVAILLIFLIPG
jgi:hypothetical protein